MPRFTAGRSRPLVALGIAVAVLAASCHDDVDPCGPHGWLHDDHCHCDRGFVPDGRACVPAPDAGVTPDAAPDADLDNEADTDADPDAGVDPDAPSCRSDGPCTTDGECCEYCHVDHCH